MKISPEKRERIKKTAERLINLIDLNAPDEVIINEINLMKQLADTTDFSQN